MATNITLGTMLHIPTAADARRLAPVARDAGYTCVQTFLTSPNMTHKDVEEIRDILDEHGLPSAAVCCHLARNREEDFTFTSIDGVMWLLEAGRILGAPRLVMWSGSFTNDFRGEHPDNMTDKGMDRLETEFRKFVPDAAAAGIQICIEPYYPHVTGTPERMAAFCSRFEDRRVACCLDVPNFISPAIYDRANELIPHIVRTVAPHISIVHLKDIKLDAKGNVALPGPGDGILDYPRLIAELEKLGRPIIGITEHIKPEQFKSAHDFIAGLLS
ncbi:MAG: sugar phosphate isomerase/epimerase family protein [Planctomycetota bacterium]